MRSGAANLDVGSVRFEYAGHRILAAPVVVIVVPVAHPLVVLTVSHVSPLINPRFRQIASLDRDAPTLRREPRQHRMSISLYVAFNKDAFPNRRRAKPEPAGFINQPVETSPVFSRGFSTAIRLSFASRLTGGTASQASARSNLSFGTFIRAGGPRFETSGHSPDNRRGQQPWTDVTIGT
jgi:hypothetical protein